MTWAKWALHQIYPKGGLRRAWSYLWHRLRRLPDPPHRIARGVFVGTFANFPPIFGIQMPVAALLAWAVRGNVWAALLGTVFVEPHYNAADCAGVVEPWALDAGNARTNQP